MSLLGSLIPVDKEQLHVGEPLPWTVFDAWGNELFPAGTMIVDEEQLESIVEDCFYDGSGENSRSTLGSTSTAPGVNDFATKINPKPASDASAVANISDPNKESVLLDLDSVRWHVGEPFYLQVHDNPAIRYSVRLIGYIKNKTLLVTAPLIDGRGALIRDGQTFIVRSFPGKKAYAFTASAIKSVFTPHPYLHLSYPKVVRCTAIRQSSRASVKIIASVHIGEPEQTAAATLNDLSMGGGSGIIKRQIGQKGDRGLIKFKVNTAGEDAYLSLPVIVRSIVETENTEEYRYGFEFVDVATQSKLILSSFVHQTLAEIE
jgi:c-di-GMP-binding flagellar brake protein YcgR